MKTVMKLAWKNIWRNSKRTLFTLIAITLSISLFIFIKSYVNGIMLNSTDTMIKTNIGHIKLVHKEFLKKERIMPKEYLLENIGSQIEKIKKNPEVISIQSRIKLPVLISAGTESEGCLAMGIYPQETDKTMNLSELLIDGKYIKPDSRELIIGEGLAKKLNVKTGDELLIVTTDINYSTYALPFRINGIFKTGFTALDKHLLFIPFSKAAEMLDIKDSAHEILIYLKNRDKAESLSLKLQNYFNKDTRIIPWNRDRIVESFMPFAQAVWNKILLMVMFITGLVILNTMLMSVMERFQEFGILKAMGMKNSEITTTILMEATILGTIGSLWGAIIGGLLSLYTEINGINIAALVGEESWEKIDIPIPIISNIVYPDVNMEILISSVIFGILLTIAAVLWPAIKTNRMKPVEAFRTQINL